MPDRVEVFEDKAHEWRWGRFAENGEEVAASGEGYVRKEHALDEAARRNPDVPPENVVERARRAEGGVTLREEA